jgi:hypothetical protein
LQHGNVEKRVAGAVGQLKETKALVRSEPLDDGITGPLGVAALVGMTAAAAPRAVGA